MAGPGLEPWQRTISGLVAAAAKTHPEAPALTDGDGRTVSHGRLDALARNAAGYLAGLGTAATAPIGVLADHRIETVVALLGIVHAGHPYVPLDPRWPAGRIAELVAELDLRYLYVDGTTAALGAEATAAGPGTRLLRTDVTPPAPGVVARPPVPADLAYVIFTSGSTGTPKAVAVGHDAAAALIRWVNDAFAVGPGDQLLQVTSYAFDLSVYDVFGTLAAGACLRLLPDAELAEPEHVVAALLGTPVTFWDSAPAAMQALLPLLEVDRRPEPPALRRVFLSGDWIPVAMPDRVRARFPRAEVVALGGPTETTVWSNVYRVGLVDPEWPSIPYGGPVPSSRFYVLDGDGYPCAPGEPGELHVGGGCLSAGYLGDSRRTADRFTPSPEPGDPGGRVYATGDQVVRLPDGNLRFLGRRDDQVKIRGYRIELGEVQARLAATPGVAGAAVLAPGTGPERTLVGFYVPADPDAAPPRVRAALARLLPPYMVPAHLVPISAIPVSGNGKVDRKWLAGYWDRLRDAGARQAVLEAWAQALGSAPATYDADFFDAGGDSAAAARLATLLGDRVGLAVDVATVFAEPTVAGLAGAVGALAAAGEVR
jgi:amino acid adenylation domain-containing protein